ncbi:MAG: hypothetical protein WCI91_02290 [Candidatus Nomurabacteria bacterium]
MGQKHLREKREIHEFKKRAGWKDEHHIELPCSRGGSNTESNILVMDAYRHDAWHLLFYNKTLTEIIGHFKLVVSIKEFLHSINNYYKHSAFHLLFGRKTLDQIIALLLKVQEIKRSQRVYLRLSA